MTADALTDENSFDEPTKVAPVERQVAGLGSRFTYDFPGQLGDLPAVSPAAAGPPGRPGSPGSGAARGVDRGADPLDAPARRSPAPRGGADRLRPDGRLALPRRAAAAAGRQSCIGGRSFGVRAGRAATVRVRVSRAAYRRLSRRRSARVTVTLRTRGSDGRLRRVSARLGLRR